MALAALTLLLALQGGGSATPATSPAAPAPARSVRTTDLALGKGDLAVRPGDLVEVYYVGKLSTGKEFDRSQEGSPFKTQVGLGKVIAGWDQGLLGMKPGGKRRLEIPAVLGYGEKGAGADIPPNADLDFEVELVAIHRARYELKKEGSGAALTPQDVPTFHYVLTLANGKKVDSTRDRNVPATARLQQLIPGFVQGLLGMKPGEVRRLIITPDLAYGDQALPAEDVLDEAGKVKVAKGSLIPANSTLIFEIELVSATKAVD